MLTLFLDLKHIESFFQRLIREKKENRFFVQFFVKCLMDGISSEFLRKHSRGSIREMCHGERIHWQSEQAAEDVEAVEALKASRNFNSSKNSKSSIQLWSHLRRFSKFLQQKKSEHALPLACFYGGPLISNKLQLARPRLLIKLQLQLLHVSVSLSLSLTLSLCGLFNFLWKTRRPEWQDLTVISINI